MGKQNATRLVVALMAATSIAACGAPLTGEETAASDAPEMAVGAGTPVPAAVETVPVGTENADAADDPAIWADPGDPSRALVFGTDKKAGLYVYRLDGSVHQNLPGGMPNNVDLRDGFVVDGRPQVLVGVSDRSPQRFGIVLFVMDPVSLQTRLWGVVPVDLTEPYGFCLGKRGDSFLAIVNGTDGQVRQFAISASGDGKPVATLQKRYAVGSQTEGCVVDDEKGYVYVGEEAKGVWRYSTDPAAGAARVSVATAPGKELIPDVEGLALLKHAGKSWLMASSQGDSAFAVWRVDGDTPVYQGRFSVVANNGIDAVTGTDGIAALGGRVGNFPDGLVAVQDDVDETATPGERQNFKFLDWRAISSVLGLN